MELRKVLCPKCRHTWDSRSINVYVTCPSCMSKIKREKNTILRGSE